MDLPNPSRLQVVDVNVLDIRSRIRLRTPDENKIKELADSIKTCSLMHPITIDTDNYIVAGFHRWSAFKLLGYETIPCIVSDTSALNNKIKEIDENLKRNEIDHLETGIHIRERENILEQLGKRMKRGGNQYSKGLITTTELAEQVGMSNKMYRNKRQCGEMHPEVLDLLIGTEWAKNLMDMVKLSGQSDELQRKVADLLVSGQCRTFKRAFAVASLADYKSENGYKINFDLKERWGIPQSIMRFKKAGSQLQKVCELITHSDQLDLVKRRDFMKGQSDIPIYGMASDLAEFLITYYTPENGLILDQFCGRGTIGLSCLYHGRRFVGYDLTKKNLDLIREVSVKHLGANDDNLTLHHSDGITLKEYEGKTEYFDAIVTDPAYVLKAEKYSDDERELGNKSHEEYMKCIKINFQRCYDLIKTSSIEEKKFYPVIFKVSHGRKGSEGIIDMDFDFQMVARECKFKLWDKLTNQLHTPFASVNFKRNYIHKYVQKNMETNLVFCKF